MLIASVVFSISTSWTPAAPCWHERRNVQVLLDVQTKNTQVLTATQREIVTYINKTVAPAIAPRPRAPRPAPRVAPRQPKKKAKAKAGAPANGS